MKLIGLIAIVGNVAFAGLHLWEHDLKLATISFMVAMLCASGLFYSSK
jgi:hypothetical protein